MFGIFRLFGIRHDDDVRPVYDDPDPYDCSCDTDDWSHECGEDDDDDWDDDDDQERQLINSWRFFIDTARIFLQQLL